MLQAMKKRFNPPNSIIKSGVKSRLEVYNNQMESQSIEEVEALSSNNDEEAIMMEGFVIRDRLLGALQSAEILQPIINEAVLLAHRGDFKLAIHFYRTRVSGGNRAYTWLRHIRSSH